MADLVTLRCPRCKKTSVAMGDAFDPPGTATVEIICPECDDGDRHTPEFFDRDDKWINPAPTQGSGSNG